MPVRIINDTDWGGEFDNEFIENYPEIVAGWVLTNEPCDPNFILKKWNGANWYEGATPEEITEHNRRNVPETISAMDLKLQLFEKGITDQDIFDDIDSIPDSMFPQAEKQKAKIKYQSAAKFERYNADLNLVATMEGISQEELDQIFINGNSR